MRAAPPVCGLARWMFQDGFRETVIEVHEQGSVDQKRFPPPSLCIAGNLPTADRNIGSSVRRPGETEGAKYRADKVCTRAESGFQVEAGGRRGHKRIVQHAGSLEHGASARRALEHIHPQPRACGFVHHLIGAFAKTHYDGGRPAPPESQNLPSGLPSRARQLVINRKVFTHGPSRPTNDLQ